ncbi:hypothetical protein AcV7_003342 [Taiwanofungus camphoratus]|nr:hypothetical protein AcV7_003342 [Antrodia cinnamomea]
MASLAPPPPPNRHRASSTNVCPPLTLSTLGSRRRSNSLLDLPPPAPSPVATPPNSPPVESIRPLSLSIPPVPPRSLPPQSIAPSTPSSPRPSRTSIDSTILPMSASPTQTAFSDAFPAPETPLLKSRWFLKGPPSVHAPVLFVLMLFPLSTALVVFCMSTLPITMQWPRNTTDLAQLGRELQGYTQSGPGSMAHVIGVISIAAVWKHAWSIPGSVIWNVLAGALFSPAFATVLLTLLTTVGSVFATLLATPLAPVLSQFFPRALDLTRSALEGGSSTDEASSPTSAAWVRLSILRLIAIVPWAGINIACGVCGVAIQDCFLGYFLGSLPWTAVTCQVGDILQTVATNPSPTPQTVQSLIMSPAILTKLAVLSFLSLAPILGRNRLRAWVALSASQMASPVASAFDERTPRWAWVREWQSRIRVPSRSRAREAFRKELEVLVREKDESLPL